MCSALLVERKSSLSRPSICAATLVQLLQASWGPEIHDIACLEIQSTQQAGWVSFFIANGVLLYATILSSHSPFVCLRFPSQSLIPCQVVFIVRTQAIVSFKMTDMASFSVLEEISK